MIYSILQQSDTCLCVSLLECRAVATCGLSQPCFSCIVREILIRRGREISAFCKTRSEIYETVSSFLSRSRTSMNGTCRYVCSSSSSSSLRKRRKLKTLRRAPPIPLARTNADSRVRFGICLQISHGIRQCNFARVC